MRNLKRALSLALASVMLLGMMVVGSSAAFSDADEIVNKEAVEITAGLGLFAGSDGKFNPEGTVTRAQMAAVIAKMFYGSDLNADTYKGSGKFSDTAAFEGGWAEGYINLGVEKGWFKGYGDGTFKPGQAVTTAEAVTMILNLLGVDAGEGTWPMTVMAAAEDIELFDMEGGCELKPAPATNVALTRDQLAVMVWNGMNYSAEGIKGYSVTGSKIVFESWSDAAAYADKAIRGEVLVRVDVDDNGTPDDTDDDTETPVYEIQPIWTPADIQPIKEDTLAKSVFEISKATGYVTANQATGEEYTLVGGKKLNLETGLDMLGHYVTAYFVDEYKNEKNPGEAYCLVELAEYVTVAEDIDTKKDYLAAFGSKVEAVENGIYGMDFDGTREEFEFGYDEEEFTVTAGTYAIDLETGKVFAYIAPVSYTVDVVGRVTTTAGKEAIKIGTTSYNNNEDEDEIVEYEGIAADDVVVLKNYAGVTYVEKLEATADQKVTKTSTKDGKNYVYLNGTAYEAIEDFGTEFVDGMVAEAVASGDITYDAYIYGGKLVGLIETAGAANLTDVIYVVDVYDNIVNGTYAPTTSYYAQGVNAEGKEVSILIGVDSYGDVDGEMEEGFYTFVKYTGSENKELIKRDIMKAEPATTAGEFDKNTDKYFTAELTDTYEENDILNKADKYFWIGATDDVANRVYLSANTKFVVIDSTTFGEELEITTYTGSIAKALTHEVEVEGEDEPVTVSDIVTVAATLDNNGNKIAEMVVISAASVSLKAEDYIFVLDGEDFSAVEGGYEYEVFFTSTNEFKTIVVGTEAEAGFYGNYTIDEDGIYDLNDAEDGSFIQTDEIFAGVFGEAAISTKSGDIDLYDAADAFIVDIRGEDALEESEVAEIETLGDIKSANKADYEVVFTAILDDEDPNNIKVTHIFVTGINLPVYDEDPESDTYNQVIDWEPEFEA